MPSNTTTKTAHNIWSRPPETELVEVRTCGCGAVMEPHMAEARDRVGAITYAFVWHCKACRKVTR
jgi:hypothetical protein